MTAAVRAAGRVATALAARGAARRTALGGFLAHYRRCDPDGLRTTVVRRRGRRVWTVSRVAGLRVRRPRCIPTAGARLAKALPSAARGAAGGTVRYGRSRRLPAKLLHAPLLLCERNPLHQGRGATAEEVNVLRTARKAGHRAVRVPQTCGARRHRQLAAD